MDYQYITRRHRINGTLRRGDFDDTFMLANSVYGHHCMWRLAEDVEGTHTQQGCWHDWLFSSVVVTLFVYDHIMHGTFSS